MDAISARLARELPESDGCWSALVVPMVALLASLLPAYRAPRREPVSALHAE